MTDLKTRGAGLYSDERLHELSGGGWLFRFMEQFPQVKQVQRGVEDACLRGAIDMHVHADPCSLMPRNQDLTQVAIDAAGVGMRAVVRKDHFYSTVGEAYAVQRHIDHLVETEALAHRIEVYGGVPLAQTLDAAQIERAVRQPQFKMIWCNPVGGEPLVADGRVRPEMERIIHLAAEHGLAFNLGQPSHSAAKNPGVSDYDGLAPLCERIREVGARAVLDHPLSSFTADQIEALSGGSVYAGLFCYPTLPSVIKAPVVDPARTLELVKRLGPQRCLIASDVGMLLEPTALEAYRLMIRLLIVLGFSEADVSVMIQDNPAHLLGLNGQG
ncbi:MAG TPA: DUF6282 family protein [bacterium]|nr:DUF6282 family protein [bacterium]